MVKESGNEEYIRTTETIQNCEAFCKTCRSKLPKKDFLKVFIGTRGGVVISSQPNGEVVGIIKECKAHHLDYATGFSTNEEGDHNVFNLYHKGREIGYASVSSRASVGSLDANLVKDIFQK